MRRTSVSYQNYQWLFDVPFKIFIYSEVNIVERLPPCLFGTGATLRKTYLLVIQYPLITAPQGIPIPSRTEQKLFVTL
jgi:hypothetical protein